jgi:hypothetical protein
MIVTNYFTGGPPTGGPGLTVSISGRLLDSNGVGIPGKPLGLTFDGQTYNNVITTASDGSYTMNAFTTTFPAGVAPYYFEYPGVTTYTVSWAGDNSYAPCSNSATVTCAYVLTPTTLTINASPNSGVAPLQVTVSGTLLDNNNVGITGRTVVLYSDSTSMGTATTDAMGNYKFSVTLSQGNYSLHVEFAGDTTYAGCDESDHASVLSTPAGTPIVATATPLFPNLHQFIVTYLPQVAARLENLGLIA